MIMLCFILLLSLTFVDGKKKSEYTQKDWDRIAREWEREELEEDERERKEEMKNRPGIQFDPNDIGKIDPEQLLAQSKKGKPTMVFFNVREEYCKSEKELAKITTKFASLLLNGNIQVQNYPVSSKRAIFMVQDGSLSFEVKNVLLKQKEVESVSIDQQHWDADGDGTATFPGQDKPKAKKETPVKKKDADNMAEKVKPALKKDKKRKEEKTNTINLEDELSDEEFHDKHLKKSFQESKAPKPMTEDPNNNEIPDLNDNNQDFASDNDIKIEL